MFPLKNEYKNNYTQSTISSFIAWATKLKGEYIIKYDYKRVTQRVHVEMSFDLSVCKAFKT